MTERGFDFEESWAIVLGYHAIVFYIWYYFLSVLGHLTLD